MQLGVGGTKALWRPRMVLESLIPPWGYLSTTGGTDRLEALRFATHTDALIGRGKHLTSFSSPRLCVSHMGVLSDSQIRVRCVDEGMITPFTPEQVKDSYGRRVVSYGLSSYGYDIRLGYTFTDMTHGRQHMAHVDPKEQGSYTTVETTVPPDAPEVFLPPHSHTLGVSFEYIKVPRDILVVCIGKSTYARCGLIVNVTPLEPGWEGYITLELANVSDLPIKVYAGEGIAQLIFHRADHVCDTSYSDRKGKYQNQVGVVLPRV